ncbi:MAG: hypothetical protein ABI563_20115 [Specibacter sp.]
MMENKRQPIGVPPRRHAEAASVQNLLKSNRSSSAKENALAAPASSPNAEQTSGSVLKQVSYYMPKDDVTRAKAAYTATNGHEDDHSWSDFITKAVRAEVARREELYNEGQRFQGGRRNLAPGRKIQL